MEWHYDAGGPIEAEIGVPAGVLDVTHATDGTVAVRLDALRAGRRTEDLIAETEVSFAAGRLRVQMPERQVRSAEVHCTVSLPEGSALTIRTASADVRCPMRLGRFSGTTASGDVVLAAVDADVIARTASGDLRCELVGGSLHARTASGDVAVRRVAGEAHVSTASGDVAIGDAGGSVKAESASGDVTIERASTGRVQASTASGDVAVGVAGGVGAYLDVTTVTGDTTTTLAVTEAPGSEVALEIVCRTVSGDVSIRRAAS